MEQLVARRAHNPKVTGSSPVPATLEDTRNGILFFVLKFHESTLDGYPSYSRLYKEHQKWCLIFVSDCCPLVRLGRSQVRTSTAIGAVSVTIEDIKNSIFFLLYSQEIS
jgi:hypothetical protein